MMGTTLDALLRLVFLSDLRLILNSVRWDSFAVCCDIHPQVCYELTACSAPETLMSLSLFHLRLLVLDSTSSLED